MLRRIIRLIDSAWERDGYSSFFSLRQRLLWITPLIVVIPLIGLAQAFGASSTGRLTTLIAIVGIVACLLMFGLSMYRWLVGYSRTEYQEAQAAAQRVRCLIPRFDGAILSPEWKDAVWDRYVTGAPRPRTPSEQQYSDRKLRSRR